ncbi:MAG: outer membrane protein assembly factor BamD [Deltaproteobacteria bacterium]|nr:outer membrane protein assembly factor BamD [Deltaproteobacteria bacterium]MBW1941998.1 outer membrane protein assembly factor BamD [Deltaproteobacteria bacterium]
MRSLFLSFKYILTSVLIVFMLSGCANLLNKYFPEEDLEDQEGPPGLMVEGDKQFNRGNWEEAIESYETVKDRYPYSKEAVVAELKMADSLYESEFYEDAFEAYNEFERLHPKNKNIPYVIYRKGMCYYQQITTIDREQDTTLRAKEEFERVIKRFPRNVYANKARKNIRKCLIFLAENELYVAHYYYRMKKYRAARQRYSYIIENYPDMGQYHEALDYIKLCDEKLAEWDLELKEEEEEEAGKETKKKKKWILF